MNGLANDSECFLIIGVDKFSKSVSQSDFISSIKHRVKRQAQLSVDLYNFGIFHRLLIGNDLEAADRILDVVLPVIIVYIEVIHFIRHVSADDTLIVHRVLSMIAHPGKFYRR